MDTSHPKFPVICDYEESSIYWASYKENIIRMQLSMSVVSAYMHLAWLITFGSFHAELSSSQESDERKILKVYEIFKKAVNRSPIEQKLNRFHAAIIFSSFFSFPFEFICSIHACMYVVRVSKPAFSVFSHSFFFARFVYDYSGCGDVRILLRVFFSLN